MIKKTYIPSKPRNPKLVNNGGSRTTVQGGGDSTEKHTHPNKPVIDQLTQADLDVLAKLSLVDGNLKVDTNLWSVGELSAYGLGEGSGGGGGSLVVWGTESNGTIPLTVEGISKTIALKSGLDLKQDKLIAGSGITITGNTISANIQELSWDNISGKPLTYTPSAHSHPISDITNLQTALNSKLETSVFNTHNNDNIRHITGAERTKWDTVVTDFDELEIGGRNLLQKTNEKSYRLRLPSDGTLSYSTVDGMLAVKAVVDTIDTENVLGIYTHHPTMGRGLELNTDYILSVYIRGTKRFDDNYINTTSNSGASINRVIENGIYDGEVNEDNFVKYTAKMHFKSGFVGTPVFNLYLFIRDVNVGDWIEIHSLKIEKGNKPTDWTPAPEDQVSDWDTTDVNSFSFIKNKPTKLSDFTDNIGIGAHIANNVIHITSAERTNWNDANTKKHTHANKPVIDQLTQADINVLAKLSLVDGNLKVDTNLYSTGEVSAYGIGSGSGGGGGGSLVTWGTTTNNFVPLTVEGISKTVALLGHTHTKAQIGLGNVDNTSDLSKPISTATQTALNSKLETSTFNTHNTDNVRHITGAERTKWDTVVTDFAGLEIGGRNLIILRDVSRGYLNFENGVWTSSSSHRSTGFIDVARLNEVVLSHSVENKISWGRYIFYDEDKNYLDGRVYPNDKPLPFVLKIPNNVHYMRYSFDTRYYDENLLKLEKGNKPTDWTPAPEDQVSDWDTTDVNSFSFIKNKPTQLSQFTDNIGVATHIVNTSNPHNVTKAQVGLGNVDNTSDLNKPISTATQTALNLKANLASPTFTGTVTAPTFIGALSGNASTATTLQTARTLWGQSFNGEANVSGAMTGVTTLAMAGALSGATTITASTSVTTPKVIFSAAGWSMEQVGSELQMKHNNVLKMRFTSTGSIVATNEITAFG